MRAFPNSKKEDKLALDEASSLIQDQFMIPTLIHEQVAAPLPWEAFEEGNDQKLFEKSDQVVSEGV